MEPAMFIFCTERGMPNSLCGQDRMLWLREYITKTERIQERFKSLLAVAVKDAEQLKEHRDTLRAMAGSIGDELEQLPLDIATDVGFANLFSETVKLVKYHESLGET